MNNLLEIGLTNAVLATILAMAVWLATRFWRQPVFVHALWVVVLLKLITPPMVGVPWRLSWPSAIPAVHAESLPNVAAEQIDTAALPAPAFETEELISQPLAWMPPIETTRPELETPGVNAPVEGRPTVESRLPFSWVLMLATTWIAGSLVFLVITVARLVRFNRALSSAAPAPEGLSTLADQVAARFGLSGRYRLRVAEGRLPPLLWPIGRPTILLSRQLLDELSPDESQTLLAHELAHLRRKDHWVRWLDLVAAMLYWWHPVAWWARTMIRNTEERACDAWVVWALPDSGRRYAAALFTAVEFVTSSQRVAPMVASRLDSGGNLKERIEDVMSGNCRRQLGWPALVVTFTLAMAVLPFSLRAESADDVARQSDNKIAPPTAGTESAKDHVAQDAEKQAYDENMEWYRTSIAELQKWATEASEEIEAIKHELTESKELSDTQRKHKEKQLALIQSTLTGLRGKIQQFETQLADYQRKPLRAHASIPAGEEPRVKISPGTMVLIRVAGMLPAETIADKFVVEPSGAIALGPEYGRVNIGGMTVAEAEAALSEHLKKTFKDPKVQVTMTDREPERRQIQVPADPYHIGPGDLLKVIVTGANIEEPIADTFLVEPGGTIPLGPSYGRVKVAGMTLEQAEKATYDLFHKWFARPKVQITLGGWQHGDTDAAGRPESLNRYTWAAFATPQRPVQADGQATSDEIHVLREHVNFLEQRFKVIDAKNQAGSPGGSQDVRDMTGYEMATAQAQLALAEDRRDEAMARLQEAEKFAESGFQAARANYDAGRITNDMVLQAANNLADSRRRTLRFRESQVSAAGQSPHDDINSREARQASAGSTVSGDSPLSIGVVKKLVEGQKQNYERLQALAKKNLVSTSELERTKNEYEAELAHLEQVQRALKHSKLLVELAETEYQEALSKYQSGVVGVTEFDVRKLEIKVELAKAKVEELAE